LDTNSTLPPLFEVHTIPSLALPSCQSLGDESVIAQHQFVLKRGFIATRAHLNQQLCNPNEVLRAAHSINAHTRP
jgi:hypothetical protein